jgi:hypothetical protein
MVRLRRDLPDSRLSAGACGAIVFAGGADGYLVEFGEGEQGRVLAVKCDDVEPVAE